MKSTEIVLPISFKDIAQLLRENRNEVIAKEAVAAIKYKKERAIYKTLGI